MKPPFGSIPRVHPRTHGFKGTPRNVKVRRRSRSMLADGYLGMMQAPVPERPDRYHWAILFSLFEMTTPDSGSLLRIVP